MHWIQNHILQQLILFPDRRYADLKPANVEGNLFMYHLRQLLKEQLVQKRDDGRYELTASGQVYADRLSLKTFKPRLQPRIVTLVACQNAQGQWLLYRRKRQPLIGQVGFPYGKLHVGELVQEAAERELKEKTGLDGILQHRGDGYITIIESGSVVSQVMFHLFYSKTVSGKLKAGSTIGQAFWGDPKVIPPGELIRSVPDLIRLLQQHPRNRFFAELSYD
jgi:ADP-ribose pyrophosphatase YjhB (NUDIX family)